GHMAYFCTRLSLVLRCAGLRAAERALLGGGDLADAPNPRVAGRRYFTAEQQPNPAPVDTALLHAQQRLAPDEIALVESDPAIQPHMERRVIFADVIPIQREGFLQPQRVHGRDAIRPQPEIAPGAQQELPQRAGLLGRSI